MDAVLGALAQSELAGWLRVSQWGYACVNAAHILGLAVLVGAVVALNLRLLGAWREVEHTMLARVLVPVAASGLALAVSTGALLFIIRAQDYASLGIFQVKMVLVFAGTVSALTAHWRWGWRLERARPAQLRSVGAVSIGCWLGALALGRAIGFAD